MKPAGKLHVAMQLISKASIQIAFGCEDVLSDGWINADVESIDYEDTVKVMKEKVARACWSASKNQTENLDIALLMSQLKLNEQYEVSRN